MVESERDKLMRLEFDRDTLRNQVSALTAQVAELTKLVTATSQTLALLAATVGAMTRAFWLLAGVVATVVGGAVLWFVLKGGLTLAGGGT